MVDLDSNPTKLIEVVEIGKQLLMTRGALTTFSIANDVAKYFAIIPAMFIAFYPQLQALNIMGLSTPQSAILSAIIFNAVIIVALIPLALKGVRYRPVGAGPLLGPQPPHLRSGRDHRSIHRHQGHRHGRDRRWPCLRESKDAPRNSTRARHPRRADDHHRPDLPARHDRDRPVDLSAPGRGQLHRKGWHGHRLRAHRPELHQRPLFPRATVCRRRRLQRRRLEWLQPRPNQCQADRARHGRRRKR